jgi:hypothetical protein
MVDKMKMGLATVVVTATAFGCRAPGPSRLESLIEANIVAVHAFQVSLARQGASQTPDCFAPGPLSESDLSALVDHQTRLLAEDVVAVRAWVDGRPSSFDPARDLEPLLQSRLPPLSQSLPVNVFARHLAERAPNRPRAEIRAIANLHQTVLEVERDGDRLQELFAFYIGLGLPVYVGQLGLAGNDSDLLAVGQELAPPSCPAPFSTDAAAWQIAGRKIWNWGEKNLHIRDARVLADELLTEPDLAALLPRIRALDAKRIAVIGHSFTMDLHWSSPSAFVPIVTAILARENPQVVVRQFAAGGLTASRARTRFFEDALAWQPDLVLFVVAVRTEEDVAALVEMGRAFTKAGATAYSFDDLNDPEDARLDPLGRSVAAARQAGMTVVEVGALLASAPDRDRFVCLDGIHMTEPYHKLMAREWLKLLVGARQAELVSRLRSSWNMETRHLRGVPGLARSRDLPDGALGGRT